MRRAFVLGSVLGLLLASAGSLLAGSICTYDAAQATTLRIENLCEGFKLWSTGPDSFTIVCPGKEPPAGAIELRRYYDFGMYGR